MSALSAIEAAEDQAGVPGERPQAELPQPALRLVPQPGAGQPGGSRGGAAKTSSDREQQVRRHRGAPLPPRDRAAGPVLMPSAVLAPRERPAGRPTTVGSELGSTAGRLAPPPLRLTRRGRAVVAGLVVAVTAIAALAIALAVAGGAQAANHGEPGGGYQGMREIVVRPGQTLWSIASAAEPTADPRLVVQEIMSVNAMTSTNITVGQLLWVPS